MAGIFIECKEEKYWCPICDTTGFVCWLTRDTQGHKHLTDVVQIYTYLNSNTSDEVHIYEIRSKLRSNY